jgi:TetR/AcrR family transcriptional regulator, lmrAB and yxaGH operons repressor
MTETDLSTRERLVITAAALFRQKGYHGTGLAEILDAAKAPKGSLYHHFPDGKQDLALAAADWASQGMVQIIADSFQPANDYRNGATTLCYKLAKFYDIAEGWNGCPVSHALFDGPLNETFREKADQIYTSWTEAIAAQAIRLGENPDRAADRAETLIMSIQGAWVLARARQSSDVLRQIPKRLFD